MFVYLTAYARKESPFYKLVTPGGPVFYYPQTQRTNNETVKNGSSLKSVMKLKSKIISIFSCYFS